jgi:PAS domain S-box-containing protein
MSWNDAAECIYGYTSDEAIGQSMAMLIPPDRRDEEARIMFRPRFGQFEAVRLRKDGERIHVAVSISPIHDENGVVTGAVSISQDITLRVALEERLRHRQKVDAIDQLIGGIAHDFNNLLTIIVSCSDEMWYRERHDPEVLMGLALEIRKAAGLAATMTNRLARLTRKKDVHVARLDLNAAIAELLELLRRALSENIELCVDLDPAECFVQADAGQIEQILLNLVVNARDAMPRGGRLAIETRIIPPDEPGTGSSAVPGPRSRVLLTVSDTGCGMPADVRGRIFEPFFTTKDNVDRRSGLGLTMVAGIVREMGGHVEVASAVGEGTTFTIYLPRTAQNDES